MDSRLRIAVLSGAFAAISASSSLLLRDASVSSDFWRRFPIGLNSGMSVLAIALTLRGRSRCTISDVE